MQAVCCGRRARSIMNRGKEQMPDDVKLELEDQRFWNGVRGCHRWIYCFFFHFACMRACKKE